MKLAIAIPTYNEAANIKNLLPAVKKNLHGYPGLDCTVFVIDDNSPDGTAKIAEELGQKLKDKTFSFKVLRRKQKEGLGPTLQKCHNIVQAPIVFMDRQHGYSKLPRYIIIKNLLLDLKIRYGSGE